jgi:hypothetical protein
LQALFAIFLEESQIKTLSINKILQKVDEFSTICSVSAEKLYKALSAKHFRPFAEFSAPPTF